jgi:hypothetical protein
LGSSQIQSNRALKKKSKLTAEFLVGGTQYRDTEPLQALAGLRDEAGSGSIESPDPRRDPLSSIVCGRSGEQRQSRNSGNRNNKHEHTLTYYATMPVTCSGAARIARSGLDGLRRSRFPAVPAKDARMISVGLTPSECCPEPSTPYFASCASFSLLFRTGTVRDSSRTRRMIFKAGSSRLPKLNFTIFFSATSSAARNSAFWSSRSVMQERSVVEFQSLRSFSSGDT